MDIKRLIKNTLTSFKTTVGLYSFIKRLLWVYGIPSKKHQKRHIYFKYPFGKFSLIVRNNNGSDNFIFSEVFDKEYYKLKSEIDILTILDLGANAGFTSIYYSKLFPYAHIACVEPIPENIHILKENLILNKIDASIFSSAISINNSSLKMAISEHDYGHKVSHIQFGKKMNELATIEVKAITINDIIEKLSWKNIDLLKIDIEGYEGVLLSQNNEWIAFVNIIVMEIHEGIDIEKIKNIMKSFGMAFYLHKNGNHIFSKKFVS